MQNPRKDPHDKLQRRVLIGAVIFAVLSALIAVPLIVNDQLRYDLSMRSGQIPGQDVEKIAEGDSGATLIVIPIDHDQQNVPTPWLFKAQFIAWPVANGIELQNLETDERIELPITDIDFIAANGDGSLVLFRGVNASTGDQVGLTIEPSTMAVNMLSDPEATPVEPGDWETSIWEKQGQRCHRPSPNKRFLACFDNAELRSYFAGDWELNVQRWGNFQEMYPVFRGMGLLPITGFAEGDTVIYFQNENGIWRAEIPEEALEAAPEASPIATPQSQ